MKETSSDELDSFHFLESNISYLIEELEQKYNHNLSDNNYNSEYEMNEDNTKNNYNYEYEISDTLDEITTDNLNTLDDLNNKNNNDDLELDCLNKNNNLNNNNKDNLNTLNNVKHTYYNINDHIIFPNTPVSDKEFLKKNKCTLKHIEKNSLDIFSFRNNEQKEKLDVKSISYEIKNKKIKLDESKDITINLFNKKKSKNIIIDLFNRKKLEELESKILSSDILVVYGPPGSGKTTAIKYIFEKNNIDLEYIEEIHRFKGKILNNSKKYIFHTDIENINDIEKYLEEYVKKEKIKIIVESRNISKYKNIIKFNKISDSKIKKYYKDTKYSIDTIDGNLHRIDIINKGFNNFIAKYNFFHIMGKLFYDKENSFEIIDNIHGYDLYKNTYYNSYLTECLLENYIDFVDIFGAKKILDGFIDNINIDETMILVSEIFMIEKNKNNKFRSFRPPKKYYK
ncbi:hypothetical protein SLOPH_1687 [Spraguea lophii 42_110]|uniref:Uncharacterized protein n=1 Tax=Spraguea lophii (strain 42_110) TaxID=1358809 RepID=S7W7Q1_SPRLO|nr:hypothetical protein SLOPH_1687 [Spraguea lophii 42_110]